MYRNMHNTNNWLFLITWEWHYCCLCMGFARI